MSQDLMIYAPNLNNIDLSDTSLVCDCVNTWIESSTAVKAEYNCQESACEPIIFPIYGESGRLEIEKGTTATIICASIGARASLISPSGEVIGRKGALKLRNPQESHEGTYECVSGDVRYHFDVALVENQQPTQAEG